MQAQTQTHPAPPAQPVRGQFDKRFTALAGGRKKSPIVDRGYENKTWMKYRLRNPRLRYFDDPIVDKVIRPALHVEVSEPVPVPVAKEKSAIAAESVDLFENTGPRSRRPLPAPSADRIAASASPSLQRPANSWVSLPVRRVGGPIGWIAVAAVGASAWLVSSSYSGYRDLIVQFSPLETSGQVDHA